MKRFDYIKILLFAAIFLWLKETVYFLCFNLVFLYLFILSILLQISQLNHQILRINPSRLNPRYITLLILDFFSPFSRYLSQLDVWNIVLSIFLIPLIEISLYLSSATIFLLIGILSNFSFDTYGSWNVRSDTCSLISSIVELDHPLNISLEIIFQAYLANDLGRLSFHNHFGSDLS